MQSPGEQGASLKHRIAEFFALKRNIVILLIAIFVIGIVGLMLEYALIKIATAFTFEEVKS